LRIALTSNMNKPLTRSEVAIETTWNLADLFATRDQWLAELAAVEGSLESVVRHQGRLAAGPAVLLACLDARDALLARLDRVDAFAGLREAEDGGNAAHQADLSNAAALGARVHAAVKFVDSEILALPEGTLAAYLRDEPALSVYRPTLDELAALRPHMLSAETERVLASLGEVLDAPHTIYSRAKTGDVQFARSPMRPAPRIRIRSTSTSRPTKRTGPERASRRLGLVLRRARAVPATMGGTFATEVAKNIVLARARGYDSAERFLLHTHKISFELYTNVLDILQAELAPHMRRYARLRRRVLGLDKLLYCDIKAPLDPGYAPAVKFEDTGALLADALAPLGAEYVGLVRSAFRRRWIDRASNVGKASGAFCATPYGVHSFILMTWTDSMRDAFTLAHELGHGHFMLAGQHQRMPDSAMPFVERRRS
jgi:oligoendopeptidase F